MRNLILLLFLPFAMAAQTRLQFEEKTFKMYVSASKDTIRAGDYIQTTEPSTEGAFRFIFINDGKGNYSQAEKEAHYKRYPIKFFRTKAGVTYAFCREFAIDIEGAQAAGEVTDVRLR